MSLMRVSEPNEATVCKTMVVHLQLAVVFLETRSSFEYPVLGESGMLIDPDEHPAKYVVLFDDLRPRPEGSSRIENLTSLNHTDVPVAQLSGTRRRHREMMRRH